MKVIYHAEDNVTLCTIETDNPEWIISAATESTFIYLRNKAYIYDSMYLRHDDKGGQIESSLHINVNIDASKEV